MLVRLEISDSVMGDINRARGHLDDFKRKHAVRLKQLRDSMAAHREGSVVLQFTLLDGPDRLRCIRRLWSSTKLFGT